MGGVVGHPWTQISLPRILKIDQKSKVKVKPLSIKNLLGAVPFVSTPALGSAAGGGFICVL